MCPDGDAPFPSSTNLAAIAHSWRVTVIDVVGRPHERIDRRELARPDSLRKTVHRGHTMNGNRPNSLLLRFRCDPLFFSALAEFPRLSDVAVPPRRHTEARS